MRRRESYNYLLDFLHLLLFTVPLMNLMFKKLMPSCRKESHDLKVLL